MRQRYVVPEPVAVVAEEAFSFVSPQVVSLANQTIDAVLAEAQDRSKRVERIPVNRLSFLADGTLDNGMGFTEEGFTRTCRILGIPKGFVERLASSGARMTAVDAFRHIMRHADDDVVLTAMDGVVEGANTGDTQMIPNFDAAEMLFESSKNAPDSTDLSVSRAVFTGTRMHLSVTSMVRADLHLPGDVIRAGVEMTNGDDGSAYTDLDGFLYRLICSNGAVIPVRQEEAARIEHKRHRDLYAVLNSRVTSAVESSIILLGKVLPAVRVKLDRIESNDLFLRGAEKFGRQFADDVSVMSINEAVKHKRDEPTAYDWWNAVTDRAKSAPSMTRRRSIEAYSTEVLDWADRRYRNTLEKVGASDN